MTHRLLVNPETPHQWEIPLPPGTIRVGRRDDNDHQIDHPSVSGSHCEIIVDGGRVTVRDLGSTNGTFVNGAPTREAVLIPGQQLQLGNVALRFESAGAPEGSLVPPAPAPKAAGPLRLNLTKPTRVEVQPTQPAAEAEAPPLPPPVNAPALEANPGNFFCKSHTRTLARYFCPKCRKHFCELCVTTRPGASDKICRGCGVPLTALHVPSSRPTKTRNFYSRLPGAFVYPFKGFGVAIIILAALLFGGVGYLVNIGVLSGPFGWALRVSVYGLLFLFMQNIVFTTTSDENETLGFPDASEVFGAAFQLSGTILLSFGLALGLLVARLFGVDIPMPAIIAAAVLGCLYFPMAILAVAMKDTVWAANPLIVIPTILRLPLEYFVTTILTMTIFGLRLWGGMLSDSAGNDTLTTNKMSTLFTSLGVQAVWALVSVYLLSVNMRILGLLYNAKRERFGWFSR